MICLKYCSGVIATRSLYTIFLKPEKIRAQYVEIHSHGERIKQFQEKRKNLGERKKEIVSERRKKRKEKEEIEKKSKVFLGWSLYSKKDVDGTASSDTKNVEILSSTREILKRVLKSVITIGQNGNISLVPTMCKCLQIPSS